MIPEIALVPGARFSDRRKGSGPKSSKKREGAWQSMFSHATERGREGRGKSVLIKQTPLLNMGLFFEPGRVQNRPLFSAREWFVG